MKLDEIINQRMSSFFSIYSKEYTLLDQNLIREEFQNIKNYLLNEFTKDDIIALYLSNDYHYLLTLLACQEIGLTYIPLKNNWPSERVNQIKNLTNFKKLITDDEIISIKKTSSTPVNLWHNHDPNSPLYIMFTSGSTGEPKGVVIRRKSYENFLLWIDNYFSHISKNDRLINSTAYTFDVSLMEIGLFLVKNVQFFCSNLDSNPLVLGKEISDLEISIAVTVPNNFNLILSDRIYPELKLNSLKHAILAGSKITPALFERFSTITPWVNLYNCYGPTEATIYCVAKKLENIKEDICENTVSIGKAILGCKAINLKDDNTIAKPFEKGELLIGGIQLMKEYFNRKELTEKVFHIFENETYYKTGDIVFTNNHGEFFVSGRVDDTIKVSGQRVNLSDIDGYVANLSYIEEAATIAIEDEVKDATLITFLVLSDKSISEKKIKEDLKATLLSFQVPTKIIIKEALPLNNSGKISKKILKEEYLKS